MHVRKRLTLGVLIAGVAALGGCGGDDSTTPGYDGGGVDGATSDGGVEAAPGDSSTGDTGTDAGQKILAGPSHGSAVAISPDESVGVIVNRDVGTVTVVRLAYPTGQPATVSSVGEVAVGGEPWQVVISPDGASAYVVLRKDQKVVKIGGLTSTPAAAGSASVGSEPTGIAMTPTGKSVWIANWVDGTATEVDTASMTVKSTIDLNAALVATGYLGTVGARPALAHPRSVAISNNGDTNDADESVYVTEYFGQATAPEAADGSNADTRKSGVVYRIKLSDKSVSTIALAPIADIGFKDQNNGTAGCYPNQVQSITINGKFAYVTSVCASPKGPIGPSVTTTACTTAADCTGLVDPVCIAPAAGLATVCADVAGVKTTTAPVVSVIDTTTNTELASATASLNAKFRDLYVAGAVTDNASRRYPLLANDMAFVPGSGVGYVTANGADAVFRVRYDATSGAIAEVGASTGKFIDLNPAGIAAASAGLNPIGIAIAPSGHVALVASEVTHVATVIDFNTQAIAGGAATPSVVATTAAPTAGSAADKVLKGRRFFNTGLGRWSLKGQGWGACQSCHVDGLTDNVTFYFARGPRQPTSLDGTFASGDPTDQRVLNWTAIFDEMDDFELNTRGVSGGVGAIVSATTTPPATADRIDIATACAAPPCTNGNGNGGLNGSAQKAGDPANLLGLTAAGKLTDWSNITAFIQNIRSPRGPSNLDAAKVAAGRALFTTDGACQGCHGGAKWTISKVFYDPTPANTTALKAKSWTTTVTGSGFPSALLPATTAANQVMRFGGANPAAFDQILCILRPVGTFNVAEPGMGISERRADMTTAAQGNATDGNGFNPPSLLGLATGAPYLHAGQVRTLEALFASTFATHHHALAPNFLTDSDPNVVKTKVDQLVAFLLSIDESSTTVAIPAFGSGGGSFCSLH